MYTDASHCTMCSDLSLWVPEAVSIQRAMEFNRTKVNQFMDILENLLFNDNLRIVPAENICNAYESGISVCQDPSKIFTKKGTKAGILKSAVKGQSHIQPTTDPYH